MPDEPLDPDPNPMAEHRRRLRVADAPLRPIGAPTLLVIAGLAVAAAGWLVLLYYWQVYDPTVTEPDGRRVYHLGRVGDRLAGMLAGGAIALTGALIAAAGWLRSAAGR